MSEKYLDGLTPDSLSGLIFGLEGIRNSLVILNGPTGCKFFHSITAENQSVRKDDYDPLNWPEEWFFGQRRVPCTYLDKRDYVYGSEGKLTDAVRFILGKFTPEVLAVVNSPGAALIGDDLERIVSAAVSDTGRSMRTVTFQSPGWSEDVIEGYRKACRTVIDTFAPGPDAHDQGAPKQRGAAPVVNLLGLSIYQKYHAGDEAELRRLLELCGIQVNTALLCECTPDELERVPQADFNVVVDTDWGLDSAEYLKEKYGTPYVKSEYGYPAGFKAAEKLITDVCAALSNRPSSALTEPGPGPAPDPAESNLDQAPDPAASNLGQAPDPAESVPDPAPALIGLEKARARAYVYLARVSSLTGLPKGAGFTVYGAPARRKGYASFLTDYLGMIETEDDPEIILGDGNTIARMKAEGKRFSGIEISLPSIGYIDVIDKTHIGAAGGLLLIEQVLNSFVY